MCVCWRASECVEDIGATYKAIHSSMQMLSPVMALAALNPLALLVTVRSYLSPYRSEWRKRTHLLSVTGQQATLREWLKINDFFFFLNSLISHLAGGLREGFVWHGRYFYASAEGERLKIIAKGFAYTNNVFFSFFQGEPVFTSAEKCRHNHSVE